MSWEEAKTVWNAAWEACLEIEILRRRLPLDEHFTIEPKEWCFDSFALANGLGPPPVVTFVTAKGTQERHWNAQSQQYE